jgi:CDP-glucose 4,6-dehydratase
MPLKIPAEGQRIRCAAVPIDPDFWASRRVLVTGHTGFKGAWLSLWLQALGARVTGLAPGPPTRPSLYELAGVGAKMSDECALDVRDAGGVLEALREASPEIVLHLAAQPMVRRSLRDPAMTYAVNVMGTVNVLEAVRQAGGEARAVVVVTSDKCYENSGEASRLFVEGDPLGGADPYSSSKACAELVTAAYRSSFFASEEDASRAGTQIRIASARAGNVIGGGDWGEDRLVGDIVRAVGAGEPVRVRNPGAVRPWQHVLNPLSGYLLLAQELWRGDEAARAWNFGPRAGDARTVGWIVERLGALWGGALTWELDEGANPPEAGHLALDSGNAERGLRWRPGWDLEEALERVVEWHEAHRRGEDMRRMSLDQIAGFA